MKDRQPVPWLLNWRYPLIVALALVAVFGVLGEPEAQFTDPANDILWLQEFWLSKIVGAAALGVLYLAVPYWRHRNLI